MNTYLVRGGALIVVGILLLFSVAVALIGVPVLVAGLGLGALRPVQPAAVAPLTHCLKASG